MEWLWLPVVAVVRPDVLPPVLLVLWGRWVGAWWLPRWA